MKLAFVLLFAVGALLAGTANLQLTAGVILMLISYGEIRKAGIKLEDIDDVLLAKIRETLNK